MCVYTDPCNPNLVYEGSPSKLGAEFSFEASRISFRVGGKFDRESEWRSVQRAAHLQDFIEV